MTPHLPGADRIAAGPLSALILLPALAGLAIAAGVAATAPEAVDPVGWPAYAATIIKLCYLGTAAAHAGRFIMETTDGGPANPAWWTGDHDDLPVPRPDDPDPAAWRLFPNALDGALLAFGLTALVNRVAVLMIAG